MIAFRKYGVFYYAKLFEYNTFIDILEYILEQIFGLRGKILLWKISLEFSAKVLLNFSNFRFSAIFLPSVIFGQNVSVGLLTFGESDLRLLAALLEKYT